MRRRKVEEELLARADALEARATAIAAEHQRIKREAVAYAGALEKLVKELAWALEALLAVPALAPHPRVYEMAATRARSLLLRVRGTIHG